MCSQVKTFIRHPFLKMVNSAPIETSSPTTQQYFQYCSKVFARFHRIALDIFVAASLSYRLHLRHSFEHSYSKKKKLHVDLIRLLAARSRPFQSVGITETWLSSNEINSLTDTK